MNEQEQFWQGQFGDNYTARNIDLVENNYQMFNKIFGCWHLNSFVTPDLWNINSIIEFGAGSGQNILALQRIFPDAEFTAVEINQKAIEELWGIDNISICPSSILNDNINPVSQANLVLTKGLLIHIHPDNINKAYEVLYNTSNKYILLCEYYSPDRVMIPYREENDKLWKFDFVKPMLDKRCKILDYGFVSKYDKYSQDDLHWFLMEK